VYIGEKQRLEMILKQKETEIEDIKKVIHFSAFKNCIFNLCRLRIRYKTNVNVYRILFVKNLSIDL